MILLPNYSSGQRKEIKPSGSRGRQVGSPLGCDLSGTNIFLASTTFLADLFFNNVLKKYRRIILEDNPLFRKKQKHHGKNTSHNGSEMVGNLPKVTQQSWDLNPNLTVPASSSAFSATLILQFLLRVGDC